MKLGKGKQESSSVDNDERKMTLKDLAKTTHENKLSSHKLENNDKDVLRTSETSFKTNTRGSSFSMEKYEETSNEFEDNFTTNFNDFSPGSLSARNDTKMSGKKKLLKKNSGPKLSKTERLSGSKSPDKNKTGTPQKMVDKSWDEFDIKIKKKDIVMDDIFADMAPVLLETRKAPVKGTSMYSDKLAVVTNTSSEVGILWYIMVYYGKSWYIMVYCGTLWYIMVLNRSNKARSICLYLCKISQLVNKICL